MPSVWTQSAIVALWIFSTSWLIQREMYVQKAVGERSAVACTDLSPRSLKRWQVAVDGSVAGGVVTRVQHLPNGFIKRVCTGNIRMNVFVPDLSNQVVMTVRSDLTLNSEMRFERLDGEFRVTGLDSKTRIDFELANDMLTITGIGTPFLRKPLTIPINGDFALESLIWPIDRIDNLTENSRWTAHSADLFNDVASNFAWLTGAIGVESYECQVVGAEARFHEDRWQPCYVVEKTVGRRTAKTLVRKEDGKVLSQELPAGPFMLSFDLVSVD